jgi:hypothetical protein
MVAELGQSRGPERHSPRPGEVRDVTELQVGSKYKRHIQDRVEAITVLTEPVEWQGSMQVTRAFGVSVTWRAAEDLGRYVMIAIDQSSLHRRNSQIPPTSEERMFLVDIGLEPSRDGNWNQQSYLESVSASE